MKKNLFYFTTKKSLAKILNQGKIPRVITTVIIFCRVIENHRKYSYVFVISEHMNILLEIKIFDFDTEKTSK